MRWILVTGPVPRLVVNKDDWNKMIGAGGGMDHVPDGNYNMPCLLLMIDGIIFCNGKISARIIAIPL